ncbi:MAG: DUF4124 domain-containing protein [Burkholderiales bacterium]|nr:DUF4124 domain-containing protein [Burkholderiales bacterium]
MYESWLNKQVSGFGARSRFAAWAGITVVATTLAVSAASSFAASEILYYFVDERGVPHFSNVPTDARYRPFARVSVATDTPSYEQSYDEPASPYVDAEEDAVPLQPEEPFPQETVLVEEPEHHVQQDVQEVLTPQEH